MIKEQKKTLTASLILPDDPEELRAITIYRLALPSRARNALSPLITLGQLLRTSETSLAEMENVGKTVRLGTVEWLAERGLVLGTESEIGGKEWNAILNAPVDRVFTNVAARLKDQYPNIESLAAASETEVRKYFWSSLRAKLLPVHEEVIVTTVKTTLATFRLSLQS